jgi:hypothetical protein
MHVTPGDVTTMTFDGGSIKWFVTGFCLHEAGTVPERRQV